MINTFRTSFDKRGFKLLWISW